MAFADLIVGKWNRNLFPWFTPGSRLSGCISFVSYIKPQHIRTITCLSSVVYLSFPTSNHNGLANQGFPSRLYIFRFLHQTTTHENHTLKNDGCISFVSYIKPQLFVCVQRYAAVVYLSFPTSNHNAWEPMPTKRRLYIFRFLHQTTTKI